MGDDIAQWLTDLKLGKYTDIFAANDIEFDVLPELNEADLTNLGVSLGHRKRLMRAVAKLSEGDVLTEEPPNAGPERRQVTVMFCDLVGSTALSRQLDPEDMRDLIRSYQDVVTQEIQRMGGHVAKYMGDGVLVYFGWPLAQEDSGLGAVRAAQGIMQALQAIASPSGKPLVARIGISTGLVVVGDLLGEGASREETVIGETPNLAARLQETAAAGEIVINASTKDLLGAAFDLRELPAKDLKGFDKPVPCFVVGDERRVESRFEARAQQRLAPLVGRATELSDLQAHWRRAAEGQGHAFALVGEAGMGKSRLVRALIDSISGENYTRVSLQCSPNFSDRALWPMIQQMIRGAGLTSSDTPDQSVAKIEALVRKSQVEAAAVIPIVAELVGVESGLRYPPQDLTASARRTRTLTMMSDMLIGLSHRCPILLVIEDYHWIDPSSRELIEQIIPLLSSRSILMLMTSRPETGPEPILPANVARSMLQPLGRESVKNIVSGLTSQHTLPQATIETILSRSDGVPLFVEEMTQVLLARPPAQMAGDAWDTEQIPASLQDLLLMRLDQLGPVKTLAQHAACLGRHFNLDILAQSAELPLDILRPQMQLLVDSKLVGEAHDGSERFVFKHALVQEAAYASLLRKKRIEIHGKIAEALENGDLRSEPVMLAQHFSGARIFDKAVKYWEAAGQEAMKASAFVEACAHFSKALKELRKTPLSSQRDEQELLLLLSLGDPLVSTRGFAASEVSETFGRAQSLCDALQNVELQFPVLWGLISFSLVRGELDKANALAHQFLDLAQTVEMDDLILTGKYLVASSHFWRGEFDQAYEPFLNFVNNADPETNVAFQIAPTESPLVDNLCYLAWSRWLTGYPEQGEAFSRQCIEMARTNGFHDLAYALGFAAWCSQYRREHDRVAELVDELIELATQQEFPYWLSAALILKGGNLAQNGDMEAGLAEIEQGFEIWNATGSRLFKPTFLQVKAEALFLNGQTEAALNLLDEALEAVAMTGERINEADLHRVKGCAFAELGQPDKAEASFAQSIETARRQNARSFELRTTISLARFWMARGKHDEAQAALSEALTSFEEGHSTPDHIEARALLEELAGVS